MIGDGLDLFVGNFAVIVEEINKLMGVGGCAYAAGYQINAGFPPEDTPSYLSLPHYPDTMPNVTYGEGRQEFSCKPIHPQAQRYNMLRFVQQLCSDTSIGPLPSGHVNIFRVFTVSNSCRRSPGKGSTALI